MLEVLCAIVSKMDALMPQSLFIESIKPFLTIPVRQKYSINHQFFEEGDAFLGRHRGKEKTFDVDEEVFWHKTVPEFGCHIAGCIVRFTSVQVFEKHYNSAHRHTCLTCRKRLPSNHLLEIHILESHDALFKMLSEKQNMYRCLVDTCDEKFKDATQRNNHMIKKHHWPSDFRFGHLKEKKPGTAKVIDDCSQHLGAEMEFQTVQDDSEISIDTNKARSPIVYAPKMPHHICFGHGVSRGFARPPKDRKNKHWHQKKPEGMETSVNIEEIAFDDMHEALP